MSEFVIVRGSRYLGAGSVRTDSTLDLKDMVEIDGPRPREGENNTYTTHIHVR